MRKLADIPNTDAPSSDYPGGKIRDKNISVVPPVIGTPINEKVYGDIIQFFQRLLVLGSITPNELPDNVTNGYQTVEALWAAILGQFTASNEETIVGLIANKYATPASLNSRTATVNSTGLIEIATNEEVIAGTDSERAIVPSGLKNLLGEFLVTRIIEIGVWNMDTTDHVTVSNPYSIGNIREFKVLIQSDSTERVPLDYLDISFGDERTSGSYYLSSSGFELWRTTGGHFDSTKYNASINRGWIIIRHLPY